MVNSFSWAGSCAITQLNREANNTTSTRGRCSNIHPPPTAFSKLCLRYFIKEVVSILVISPSQNLRPEEVKHLFFCAIHESGWPLLQFGLGLQPQGAQRSRFLCRYFHPNTRKNHARVGDPGYSRARSPFLRCASELSSW